MLLWLLSPVSHIPSTRIPSSLRCHPCSLLLRHLWLLGNLETERERYIEEESHHHPF
ncbi:hypothetical protein AMTRI_Chr06g195050 [Amborella trichopoda]